MNFQNNSTTVELATLQKLGCFKLQLLFPEKTFRFAENLTYFQRFLEFQEVYRSRIKDQGSALKHGSRSGFLLCFSLIFMLKLNMEMEMEIMKFKKIYISIVNSSYWCFENFFLIRARILICLQIRIQEAKILQI